MFIEILWRFRSRLDSKLSETIACPQSVWKYQLSKLGLVHTKRHCQQVHLQTPVFYPCPPPWPNNAYLPFARFFYGGVSYLLSLFEDQLPCYGLHRLRTQSLFKPAPSPNGSFYRRNRLWSRNDATRLLRCSMSQKMFLLHIFLS